MVLFDVNNDEKRVTAKLDPAGLSDLLVALMNTPEECKGTDTLMLEGALKGTLSRWNREAAQG
jgi:hypothetical protein